MKLDALFVGAHRDDVEITCGGLAIKLADAGHRVGVLDLTQGEMGSRGSAALRAREAAAAAKIMGLTTRINAGFRDSYIKNDDAARLRIIEILRTYQPDLIVIPSYEQRHPDHAMTPRLIFDSCFFAGLRKMAPRLGKPFRPRKILYAYSHYEPTKPSFCVDISAQFDRKLDAIRCYASQFPPEPDPATGELQPSRVYPFITDFNRGYGHAIGVTYAEPYLQREMLEVEDVLSLRGHSM